MRDPTPPESDARRVVRLAQEATARLRALRRRSTMLRERAGLEAWFTDPGEPHRAVQLCGISAPSAQVIVDGLRSRADLTTSGGAAWDAPRIALTGIRRGGVRLPTLGVRVRPTSLAIDWEPGAAWTTEAVTAFIDLLVDLTALEPAIAKLLLVDPQSQPLPRRDQERLRAALAPESHPHWPWIRDSSRCRLIVMTDTTDVLGPVDWLVIEFPADKANFSGEMARELRALIDRDVVRVLDLVFIRKDEDGSIDVDELSDVPEGAAGEFLAGETAMAMLLAEEDVLAVAEALEPGSIAAMLVWENTWAGPFAASVRHSGGQLIDSGRIPTQALLAALEAEEEPVEEGV